MFKLKKKNITIDFGYFPKMLFSWRGLLTDDKKRSNISFLVSFRNRPNSPTFCLRKLLYLVVCHNNRQVYAKTLIIMTHIDLNVNDSNLNCIVKSNVHKPNRDSYVRLFSTKI